MGYFQASLDTPETQKAPNNFERLKKGKENLGFEPATLLRALFQ